MRKLTLALSVLLLLSFNSGVSAKPSVVNINKADAAALQQNLLDFGVFRSEKVVAHRKKFGKFATIADIQKVSGIGKKLFAKNKKYLSTSKGVVKGDAKKFQAAKRAALKARKKKPAIKKKKKKMTVKKKK